MNENKKNGNKSEQNFEQGQAMQGGDTTLRSVFMCKCGIKLMYRHANQHSFYTCSS